MRIVFLLSAVLWHIGLPSQMLAQEAPLPDSLKTLPAKTAFFYGVHNGTDFLKMLAGSEIAKDAVANGISDITAQDIVEGLDFDSVEISFDEAAEQTMGAIEQHQADYEALVAQFLRNDAILVGDESWSITWESLCKCILIAKEKVMLVETKPDTFTYDGLDALLADKSFASIRVPNTMVSFQLTDTAPATRLMQEMSKSVSEQTKDELGDWLFQQHKIGEDSLMWFSYPLGKWLEPADDEKLTKDQWEERTKLAVRFRDRRVHIAVGLVKSRFVIFVGEEIAALNNLVGVNPAPRLVAQDELESVLPKKNEVLIASAYVSDRYSKSANGLGDKGLLSNLSDLVGSFGAMAKVDDIPVQQAAMAFGIPPAEIEKLGSKLKSITERWDALAAPKAGWAATISASPSGITGRSVTFNVDPRLPKTPLSVDQHLGDDVVAFYARQGTTTLDRFLIGYEFVSHLLVGYVHVVSAMMGEEVTEGVDLHYQRLNQMPLRLAVIFNEHWLPALGDGGQALVATFFDSKPDADEDMPLEISLVSGVVDDQELRSAGELVRRWANSWLHQYYEIIMKMDIEAGLEVPVIDPPVVVDDGDSDLFTIVQKDGAKADTDDAEIILPWDMDGIEGMFHWRLSGDVLAMGSNVSITKKMLAKKKLIPSGRGLAADDGVVRAVIWVDFDQAAKMFDDAKDEEAQEIARLIRSIDSYHRITTTKENKTIRRWKLSIPLGKKPE